MHQKNGVPRNVLWTFLLGLVIGMLPGKGMAQDAAPRTVGLTVPINGTKSVQMYTKKNLKTVTNQDPSVARVTAMADDPTSVQITGLRAGATRVALTDVNNVQEIVEVIVQADVEHLRAIIRQVAPTANVLLIPANENTMVLGGTVAQLEDIDAIQRTVQAVGGFQIINHLRVGGVSQVQVCVVVAQVSRDELRRMAFDFLTNTEHSFVGSTVGQAVVNPASVGAGGVLSVNGALTGTLGVPNGAPTNLFFGILNTHSGFLGFLQALKDESVVKLLAEPKLVTMSGRPASFLSGGEQAVPVPAGLGQVGVQFEEFGTRLNFLPIVLGNGRIHLEVEPEVSNLNPAFGTSINGTVVPGRDTQRVHTTVELEDGQTFAIGGLIQRNTNGSIQKVPVLGDLPFIGAAFSSKIYEERETELVILVTPRLVDSMDCNQLPRLLPGQETRNPDDFELFLEGILEAPRGPREVFPDRHYVPAYKNGPTAGLFPCAGGDHGQGGGSKCGGKGCPAGCSGAAPAAKGPVGELHHVNEPANLPVQTAVSHSEDEVRPIAPADGTGQP